MKPMRIILAGQPNVGKSSLINAMSNSRLKVGNFSGVTVEKTEICFEHHCHQIEMIDLPGTYSINGFSQEEMVARNYLLNEEYDVIINVIDSTHLTRNLLLTLELQNLNKKMVLALNMYDEARNEGIHIDAKQIEAITGIPTIAVSANTQEGIDELLDTVHHIYDDEKRLKSKISYSDAIEDTIYKVRKFLDEKNYKYKDLSTREMAIKLLIEDKEFFKEIHDKPIFMELQPLLVKSMKKIYSYYETKDIVDIQSQEYHSIARGIRAETLKREDRHEYKFHTRVMRPWGSATTILENKFYRIRILEIMPGKSMSLQRHQQRSEHWVVLQGIADVQRGEEKVFLKENESAYIPIGLPHRLGNTEKYPLQIIEVQQGQYLGDDDIERL